MSVSAQSHIHHVSVHARGALVTRRVELPALPAGEIDLVISGITPLCDPGSVRAELVGGRDVISLQTALQVPATTARAGASVEKLQQLRGKLARLAAEKQHLENRGQRFSSLTLQPQLRLRPVNVDERVADALAASSMISKLASETDQRIAALDEEMRKLQLEIDAAALDDAQRASAERMGTGHPTREITVRLGPGGAIESLDLIYQVGSARWWPVYTLRLSDGGKRANWALEALVAQSTAEDWSGVRLSLATSDLIFDARLPELPSLRLGRKQPAPKKAYRPPPEGLDRMFEAYDRAFAPPPQPRRESKPVPKPAPEPVPFDMPAPMMQAAPAGMVTRGGAPMPELAAAAPMKKARLAGSAAPPAPPMMKTMAIDLGRGMDLDEEAANEAPPSQIEPSDEWLQFDSLEMGVRGKLELRPRRDSGVRPADLEALEPARTKDPRATRGLFDHRYDAAGNADIPSDGIPHRVTLSVAEAPSQLRWRTVPREAAEVYKEAQLKNPFPTPLLAGPVDVYVEGSLLLVSEIERIDSGGTMTVGLGVEDRIRVARNARIDEGSAGLLGGSAFVDHEVTIDLTSALSRETEIEVLDRVPVSDENDLEITVTSSKPKHASYDQKERGVPVRSGLRWLLQVPPAGKSQIVFRYKLTFPSKNEIVGGNRRE
jgi:hypothetical protein